MSKYLLTICLFFSLMALNAQKLATLKVSPKVVGGAVLNDIASINLDEITFLSGDELSLVKVGENSNQEVPYQIEQGKTRTLYWSISAGESESNLTYELVKKSPEAVSKDLSIKKQNGLLSIYANNQQLLGYQYGLKLAPPGVNPAYSRSGFIHPLNTPKGDRLTRIQPKDHYHHYGIWNPWTHVLYEGDTLDFWNLNQKEATVQFADFTEINVGSVFAEYSALQDHVVLKNGKNKVALKEVQHVRVYPVNPNYYYTDVTIDMNTANESPFRILEYRYAGFGWRTTEVWDNKNSTVLTSEGRTRKDADGSTARWCIVQGELGANSGGAVMLSHPSNYNHPEPLRIWPEDQYGRGDMFANFAPTKNMDWLLTPGKTSSLKYRLVVFSGNFTSEQAENAWQHFANPLKIEIEKP